MRYIREIDLNNALKNATLTKEDLELISSSDFNYTETETIEILNILNKALVAERERGLMGLWSYDRVTHKALADAISAEEKMLSTMKEAA
jgi:hypothetical protein